MRGTACYLHAQRRLQRWFVGEHIHISEYALGWSPRKSLHHRLVAYHFVRTSKKYGEEEAVSIACTNHVRYCSRDYTRLREALTMPTGPGCRTTPTVDSPCSVFRWCCHPPDDPVELPPRPRRRRPEHSPRSEASFPHPPSRRSRAKHRRAAVACRSPFGRGLHVVSPGGARPLALLTAARPYLRR